MEQAPAGAKAIRMQQIPAFIIPDDEKSRITSVLQYLQKLVKKELISGSESLELPSIAQLSNYFKCSPLEVHDALRELDRQHYNYQFSQFNQPLQIWRKPDLATRRNA